MERAKLEVGDEVIEAEVADNFFTRAKGLSFKSSGKMLFKFSRDTSASIDMMFLSEPLYLYFLDSERKIIEIQRAEPWSWNPRSWKLYSPDKKYRYLLESFEELDVEEGDKVQFRI